MHALSVAPSPSGIVRCSCTHDAECGTPCSKCRWAATVPCAALQVDEEKEARKLERARLVLSGHPFAAGDDDPFEGLSPQVITRACYGCTACT